MSRGFSIIVAADEARGIGRLGDLPWKLPGDMAYYKRTTTAAPEGQQNAVIMGRKTFESIPRKFRPLKQRLNIVVTRNAAFAEEGSVRASSLAQALSLASENASRLSAMHAAERNIDDRLHALRGQFHRERQTSITTELLDIVSGYEALTDRPRPSAR